MCLFSVYVTEDISIAPAMADIVSRVRCSPSLRNPSSHPYDATPAPSRTSAFTVTCWALDKAFPLMPLAMRCLTRWASWTPSRGMWPCSVCCVACGASLCVWCFPQLLPGVFLCVQHVLHLFLHHLHSGVRAEHGLRYHCSQTLWGKILCPFVPSVLWCFTVCLGLFGYRKPRPVPFWRARLESPSHAPSTVTSLR